MDGAARRPRHRRGPPDHPHRRPGRQAHRRRGAGTFDTPGQAVRCATALHRAVADLGLQIRVGLHSGELERRGRDIGGVAVPIAARVMAQAHAGQVLVSRTVVELVAGSDIRFEQVREVDLKGLAARRELYQTNAGDPQ